jgi:hypothetical protein
MSGKRDAELVLSTMTCPKCQGSTRCVDSRGGPRNSIRRRRRCMTCEHRFSTYETRLEETPLPPSAVLFLIGEVELAANETLARLARLRQGLEASQLVDELKK